MLGAGQIWAAAAISGTSSVLFSAVFLAAALGFLPLPIKQSFFTDLRFQDARLAALTMAQGLMQNANGAEVDDAQERFPFYMVFYHDVAR